MSRVRGRLLGLAYVLLGGFGVVAAATVVAFTVFYSIAALKSGDTAEKPDALSVGEPGALASVPPPGVDGSLFGAVEIGSSGIKGTVWKITPADAKALFARKVEGDDSRYGVFKSAMVKHYDDYNTKLDDSANLPGAIGAIAGLVQRMTDEEGVPRSGIYIVASSGVAEVPHIDDIRNSVQQKTGIGVDVMTPEQECTHTFEWIVPSNQTYETLVIDMGSGNTKACYLESGTYGGLFRALELLPVGTKRFQTRVDKERQPSETFADASTRIARTLVPDIDRHVDGNPGLARRPQVMFAGGATWVTASLVHPEDAEATWVPLSAPADFTALREKAVAGGIDLSPLGDPFTNNQLIGALDVLIVISDRLGLERRSVVFARPARDAWMSNYLVNKLARGL